MEVKIYSNHKTWRDNKPVLVRRVDCPDVFNFKDCINVMRSLFGVECVLEFIVL